MDPPMRAPPRPLVRCIMRLTAAFSAMCGKATIAILVVFGLLLIPVECTVAMGPHTLFLSADAVASLQNGETRHLAGPHVDGDGHLAPADDAVPDASTDGQPAHQSHGQPPDTSAAAPGDATKGNSPPAAQEVDAGPPLPAGVSSDGVIVFLLAWGDAESIAPAALPAALPDMQFPPDRLLSGPETPPP